MENIRDRLQQYALVAEVLGGAAVVVTLIFLVLETRDNTNAIRTQTYQSLITELNEVRRNSTQLDMAEIREKLGDSGLSSLSAIERFRYLTNLQTYWGVLESSYYARERNVLGDSEWLRFYADICRTYYLRIELWDASEFNGGVKSALTTEFVEFVESSCESR